MKDQRTIQVSISKASPQEARPMKEAELFSMIVKSTSLV